MAEPIVLIVLAIVPPPPPPALHRLGAHMAPDSTSIPASKAASRASRRGARHR